MGKVRSVGERGGVSLSCSSVLKAGCERLLDEGSVWLLKIDFMRSHDRSVKMISAVQNVEIPSVADMMR